MKQERHYSDIALAVESILSAFGDPRVEDLTIDPWSISLRTAERLPGVEYEETTYGSHLIGRAEVVYNDEITIRLCHIEMGKVVPL